MQWCYSYDNEGSGYRVAEFDNAPPLANATIRYNVSWRDGRRPAGAMASGGMGGWSATPVGAPPAIQSGKERETSDTVDVVPPAARCRRGRVSATE